MKKEVLSSPIRWAGSKKRVLNEMLESFVNEKQNYIEPFLGSGVVMLNVLNNNDELKYRNFYVNDINSNIINFYKLLKSRPKYLIDELVVLSEIYNSKSMLEKEKMYYEIRTKFNSSDSKKKPIYFYFLMRVGFNGVYRENKMGKFNVPFGKKDKFIVAVEDLKNISEKIKNVKFYNLTYEKFIAKMKKDGVLENSFMYCDPPYIPDDKLVSQKQELYTNGDFNHVDFVEFLSSNLIGDILISMSDSTLATKIYGSKFYTKNLLDIFRTINPKKIFKSTEMLFSNYKID